MSISLALVLALVLPAEVEDVVILPEKSTLRGQGIDGIQGLRATFLVDAPPERVLETLWDVKRFPEIFPDIKKMDVLRRDETRIDVAFEVDAVIATVKYTLRRSLDRERRTVRWFEKGGDIKRIRGAWKLKPAENPDQTLVTYESFVEVGGIVPTGLYRDLAMGKVKEMAGRVRKACSTPAAQDR